MTFYLPLAFIFLILLPVIVLLYLLKQQHQDYPVPSIMLWQQALKDIEANAPWQKLRNNLLMLLQLLAVSLLVFSLAKPFMMAKSNISTDLVLIIDTSASMQAADVLPSRFEAARRKAVKLIENSKPDTRFTVINLGPSVTIEVNKSSDKSTVINQIKQMKVTNGIANYQDAKSIVNSIVNEAKNAQVILFGDHQYPVADKGVEFIDVAGKNDNAAITLLSYTMQNDKIVVLSRVSNYSSDSKKISLSLYGDEKVIDARDIALNAGETKDIYWNSISAAITLLSCKIDTKDDIEADNIARTVVSPQKNKKILLVTEKNVFLEKVISLIPGVELFKTNLQNADIKEGYNLYIYDGLFPEKLPVDGNVLVFNPPPGNKHIVTRDGYIKVSSIKKSTHLLMLHINDYNFAIAEMRDMVVPEWGETVLKMGDKAAIIAGQKESRRIVVVGFDLHHTDIPLKPAFPIMMNNFIKWLVPSRTQEIGSLLPYENAVFNMSPEVEEARIISPSGKSTKIAPPFPAVPFTQTDEIGFYTIEQKSPGQKTYEFFAVNFPASAESGLTVQKNSLDNAQKDKEIKKGTFEAGYNLTWVFALLALITLCLEWWVYNYGD